MRKPQTRVDETHVRTGHAYFRWDDIKAILTKLVADEMNLTHLHESKGVKVKIEKSEETEGSPPYPVGFNVRVTITEDLKHVEAVSDRSA